MIKVEGLSKSYDEHHAVQDISFSIEAGEIVGLLGPNGAGKSTTMKILSGFLTPSAGATYVNSIHVQKNLVEAKAQIGYLPEVPPLYLAMLVREYVEFAAQLRGVQKSDLKSAVDFVLEKCGLKEVEKRLIANLSKGYKQRVGLAQAIVHKPKVLILDEPTSGLDPKQIIEVRELISSLAGEHTIILSTHILSEVQAVCERVVVINSGKIVTIDSIDAIQSRMSVNSRVHLHVQKDPENIFQQLNEISGVLSVKKAINNSGFDLFIECAKDKDLRAEFSELVVKEKLGLLSLQTDQLSLEDAFVKLITDDRL